MASPDNAELTRAVRAAILPVSARHVQLLLVEQVTRRLVQQPHWLAQHSLAHVLSCGELPAWEPTVALDVCCTADQLQQLRAPLTATGLHCVPQEEDLSVEIGENPRLKCVLHRVAEAVPVRHVTVDDPGIRAALPHFTALKLPVPKDPANLPVDWAELAAVGGHCISRSSAQAETRAADTLARVAARANFTVATFIDATEKNESG